MIKNQNFQVTNTNFWMATNENAKIDQPKILKFVYQKYDYTSAQSFHTVPPGAGSLKFMAHY